jgi:hypothetical protein
MGRYTRARRTGGSKEASSGGRLVGVIVMLAFTIGAYWAANSGLAWLRAHPIEQYRQAIMDLTSTGPEMQITIHPLLPFKFPVDIFLRIGIAIFLDVTVFTLVVLGWMWIRPSKPGGADDPWASQGRG